MLQELGLERLEALYEALCPEGRFTASLPLPEALSYEALQEHLKAVSEKNRLRLSFIGDGLAVWKTPELVADVARIRTLSTAYTPYQPERSQGTLIAHWIYQCLLAQLTEFEAINASLYDRATALYEAICCARRLVRKGDAVLISQGLYPGDLEVVKTLVADTDLKLIPLPLDPDTGTLDPQAVRSAADALGERLFAIVFPQVNSLGLLEDVDQLADTTRARAAKSIAVIEPMLLGTGGLKPPTAFGREGISIIVGEGQSLASPPCFGGPGLGVFGVRHHEREKTAIRATPGRYVGKAKDSDGRVCWVTVLSTREQHIRKEKATSNICSNQGFIATLAGAALLARGEKGLAQALKTARARACIAVGKLTAFSGVQLAFPQTPFFNEVVLRLPGSAADLIEQGRKKGVQVGVAVSDRIPGSQESLLKLSFFDHHTEQDLERLSDVFQSAFGDPVRSEPSLPPLPPHLLREQAVDLPQFEQETVRQYYHRLGALNVSPDTACYPLGSCTMKYNPYVNDWSANLPGFTQVHPQAPLEDVQGCLEVLYNIQEWFKRITGLAGVTTQPVAGAQGELLGLKLFQAAHRARGAVQRNVILIPESAHGTNFASAAMAGFKTQGPDSGVVLLRADKTGRIDQDDLDAALARYADRISGIMITHPNTGGIFEHHFRETAAKVHAVGGYVYMDGANMNAIAGWLNLGALGVDVVHQNLHKTWSIPHGGGGPGDAVVAVSKPLLAFLPGYQIVKDGEQFIPVRPEKSIGSFHRHWGHFAHKVRCYTYLLRLGSAGIPKMSAVAVLSARYLFAKLAKAFPTLPQGAATTPRMHEFIITLTEADFDRLAAVGIPKAVAMAHVGKLFLDFGFHAPTVAFPEPYGLMIEPTESYTKKELDRFADATLAILKLIRKAPEILKGAPYFTPIDRIDEVTANRNLAVSEVLSSLPSIPENRITAEALHAMTIQEIETALLEKLPK